jgi:hypothetical protein
MVHFGIKGPSFSLRKWLIDIGEFAAQALPRNLKRNPNLYIEKLMEGEDPIDV